MNITEQQEDFLKEYIKDKDAYRKLIDYLSRHDIIGEEVFPYLVGSGKEASTFGEPFAYHPVSKDIFIKRIPFYFYKPAKGFLGNLQHYVSGILRESVEDDYDKLLEEMYNTLEMMMYHYKLDIETIFDYTIQQSGYVCRTDLLFDWAHYLQLAERFGIPEKNTKTFNSRL